ncbi:MAG: WYL domain-containing protein [Coriobacteriia bacterium]|nr:WYL domain-containing protein [Coriobacteriia bacterium]
MTPKTTATERARRLLALLPSLKPDTEIPLASLAAIVGANPEELAADITTLSMCGVPPFDPYDLVDVFIDGETVVVGMGLPALDRPVCLTPAEARALIAALETAGFGSDAPLRAKITDVLSAEVDANELATRIRTTTASGGLGDVYATITASAAAAESVDIMYFSASSGTTRLRRVRPYRVFNHRGAWYVLAFDESVAEERTFRLDRVRDVTPTDERFERPVTALGAEAPFTTGSVPGTAHVHFDDASGVEERDWPGTTITLANGGADAQVPYATTGWLARRVAAAMGTAEVTGPAEMRDAVRSLAEKMLAEFAG